MTGDLGELLSPHDIAAILKTTPKAARQMIAEDDARGLIPGIRISERRMRVRRGYLDSWLGTRLPGAATGKRLSVTCSVNQSIDVIHAAQQAGLPGFDLIVCDEAHRGTAHRTQSRCADLRTGPQESRRITDTTLIRVAVEQLLDNPHIIRGAIEAEILQNLPNSLTR